MGKSAIYIAELEREAVGTLKYLESVPNDKLTWKPHEKSMDMGALVKHIAEMPHFIYLTLSKDELDFAKEPYDFAPLESKEKAIADFNKGLVEAIEILKTTSDEELMKPWSMRNGDDIYFTMPKIAVLRTFCMTHLYHHRGQLSVYLRLNDVSLPGIIGPSADEMK